MLPPRPLLNEVHYRRTTVTETSANSFQKLPISPQTLLKSQFYTDYCYDNLCIDISEDNTNAKRLTHYENEKLFLQMIEGEMGKKE